MSGEREGSDKNRLSMGLVMDELDTLERFVRICMNGLYFAKSGTEWADHVRRAKLALEEAPAAQIEEEYMRQKEQAEFLEAFAKSEVDREYPYLLGLATIRMWTIMEAAVDDLMAELLITRPHVGKLPAFQRLKGPLMSFGGMSPAEQSEYVVELLKEDLGAGRAPGVGRFEATLNAAGLGGPVADAVRRVILELAEVRHVLVHRHGRADAKLLKERCPWLPYQVGDQLMVRMLSFRCYGIACHWYLLELARRLEVAGDSVKLEKIRLALDSIESELADMHPRTLARPSEPGA